MDTINHVFNVRDWEDDYVPDMHGHVRSYQFKFEWIDGKIQFSYKKRSASRHWLFVDQNKEPIFSTTPFERPDVVEPNLTDLRLPIFQKHLKKGYSRWLTEDQMRSWMKKIDSFRSETEGNVRVDKKYCLTL